MLRRNRGRAAPLTVGEQRELTGGDDIWQASKRADGRSVVESLLDKGASVNAPDMFGRTPLHYAGLCGQTSTVNLLLARGATDEDHGAEISSKPAARELISLYSKAAAPSEERGGTRRPRPSSQLMRELSQAGKELLRRGLDSNWASATAEHPSAAPSARRTPEEINAIRAQRAAKRAERDAGDRRQQEILRKDAQRFAAIQTRLGTRMGQYG